MNRFLHTAALAVILGTCVPAPAAEDAVAGEVRSRSRVQFTTRTTLTVSMYEENAATAGKAVASAMQEVKELPAKFELKFDPTKIEKGKTYVLGAELRQGDKVISEVREKPPAFADGRPVRNAVVSVGLK